MKVFDIGGMQQQFAEDTAGALKILASAIENGDCKVKLQNVNAIGGASAVDTLRLTLDVDVQLVQLEQPLNPRKRLRAGTAPAGE